MSAPATILVVDDNLEMQDMLQNLLGGAGYQVAQAFHGEQALALVAQQPPDLVVLDVFMARMDGYEVCQKLRLLAAMDYVPIILISAYARVEALERGLQLGAADYLTKPFQPAELLARIRMHLALGRAQAAQARQLTALQQVNARLQAEVGERQRAEVEITRMAREWQTTFNATNDAIWLLDHTQRVVRANQMAEHLFPGGCDQEHCWKTVHRADAPIAQCPVRRARQSLRREEMELPVGSRWYQITADPILDEAGQYQGAVHIFRDISALKRAQAVMAARMRLLAQARSQTLGEVLQATLDEAEALTGSQIGFYHFVDADQATITLQAWSTNTRSRMCQAEGAGQHYPVGQAGVWADCLRERRPIIHNDYASLPGRKGMPDGHAPVVREVVVPVWRGALMVAVLGVGNKPGHYDEQDVADVASLADLAWDIAENKRQEEERARLENINRQLQKSESLGRMAGAIAHHFNNQLQAVLMSLELAKGNLPAEITGDLEDAMESTHKAVQLSSTMLTYLGQAQGQRLFLDLSEVCRAGLELLGVALPPKVTLCTEFPSPGPVIHADPVLMQQVLTNLLTNAWEALGAGEGSVHLAVRTVPAAQIAKRDRFPIDLPLAEPAYACLEVRDSGCGIPAGDIEKLFDPFFSTKFTGRGLGLPMVLGIVRPLGGAITVESQVGRGSAFRLFLPLVPSATSVPPTGAGLPRAGNGELILLAEDVPAVRKAAVKTLLRLGFTVLEAADGVEAVDLYRQHQGAVRCALCDLTMPRLNGWETLSALRRLDPRLPVILISGYQEAQAIKGDYPDQPQAFLGKPFTVDALRQVLSQVLQRP